MHPQPQACSSAAIKLKRGTNERGKAKIRTFVGTLPEHLLEDLEPGWVVVDDEDAQPVREGGGVGHLPCRAQPPPRSVPLALGARRAGGGVSVEWEGSS